MEGLLLSNLIRIILSRMDIILKVFTGRGKLGDYALLGSIAGNSFL
jgi:hypothetical protein